MIPKGIENMGHKIIPVTEVGFKLGDKCLIKDGPFTDFQGIIVSPNLVRIENLGAPIELASKFKPGDIILITNQYLEEDDPFKYYIGVISHPICPYSYRISITHGRIESNEELIWARDTDNVSHTVDEEFASLIEDFSSHEAYNTTETSSIKVFHPVDE